jgi:MFS family permease
LKKSAPFIVALGAIAYVSAITQRSTIGIASLVATDRFHTNAEQLSMLTVTQLIVYAIMQIPAGLLLDRFGSRVLLSIGALSMAAGQYVVAFAPTLGTAVAGRMLVGFGDAFTFLSLIRLINGWYSGRRASQLQQWLGNGGQVGQIVSAIPFSFVLQTQGWEKSFAVWATIALIIGTLSWFLIVDDPVKVEHKRLNLRDAALQLRNSVRLDSTKMAFWAHFSTQSSTTVIVLLWGVPFLEHGEGLPHPTVVAIFSGFVVFGILFGLVFGQLCAHRPGWRRSAMTVTASSLLVSWVVMLAWPGHAPIWVIWIWALASAANAPASMVAFDYTREYVAKRDLGATNGFVNIGGFLATFTMMFVIGALLDFFYISIGKAQGLPLFSLPGFKVALITVIVVIGGGFLTYLRYERKTVQG